MDLNLTTDQMGVFENTNDPIVVRDPQGIPLGTLNRYVIPDLTPEEIAAAIKSKNTPGPRYTTQEVLDYLAQLEAQGK
jgi:hypothetical protein